MNFFLLLTVNLVLSLDASQAQTCIDPDLAQIPTTVSFTLCDGSLGTGTWSPDFPDPTNVLSGATTNSLAGTLTLPSAGDVSTAIGAYGQSDATETPTLIVPAANQVYNGFGNYGANAGVTPTLVLPAVGAVLDSTGVYGVAGTGSTPTMVDTGSWDITTSFPGSAYYTGFTSAPAASSICDSTSLLGIAGTVNCALFTNFAAEMPSTINRDLGVTTNRTISQEFGLGSMASQYALGYREVPIIAQDSDGITNSDVTSVGRDLVNFDEWDFDGSTVPRKICGMGFSTVLARITDCDTQHSTKPAWDDLPADSQLSWDGRTHGNSGQGEWILVSVYDRGVANGTTCAGDCREVWLDTRTGFLWSDELGDLSGTNDISRYNWCWASGKSDEAGSPYAEVDPDGHCDAPVRQSQTDPNSLCHEDAAWLNTLSGDTYDSPKGGMRLAPNYDDQAGGFSPVVHWRLPGIFDIQLAFINGMHHVVPNVTANTWWTSTLHITTNSAIYWGGNTLQGGGNSRNGTNRVRCIGRY